MRTNLTAGFCATALLFVSGNAVTAPTDSMTIASKRSFLFSIKEIIASIKDSFKNFNDFFYADPSVGVKVNDKYEGLTDEQKIYLYNLINKPNIRKYISGGVVRWEMADLKLLETIHADLNKLGVFADNKESITLAMLNEQRKLNVQYDELMNNANKFIVFTPETAIAMFNVLLDTVKASYGSIKMASYLPNATKVFVAINMTPGTQGRLIKNIAKLKKGISVGETTRDISAGIIEIASIIEKAKSDKTGIPPESWNKIVIDIVKISGAIGDVIGDEGVSFVGKVFVGGNEEESIDYAMALLDTLNLLVEMVPPDPLMNMVSGLIDTTYAALDAYKNGLKIADITQDAVNVKQTEITNLFNRMDDLIRKKYHVQLVSETIGSRILREDWVDYMNQPKPSLVVKFNKFNLDKLGAHGENYRLINGNDGLPVVKFAGIGIPGFIVVPNNTAMQFTNGLTFDVWVKIDSDTGMDGWGSSVTGPGWAMTLLAKSHDRTGVSLMVGHGGQNWFATFDNSWASSCTTSIEDPAIPQGTWFRVTATASSTAGTSYYVNKKLLRVCPDARPDFSTMNTQDLYIGKFSDYWYPLDGSMKELKIYKKALSTKEVRNLQ